jgi:hypothetical protein
MFTGLISLSIETGVNTVMDLRIPKRVETFLGSYWTVLHGVSQWPDICVYIKCTYILSQLHPLHTDTQHSLDSSLQDTKFCNNFSPPVRATGPAEFILLDFIAPQ